MFMFVLQFVLGWLVDFVKDVRRLKKAIDDFYAEDQSHFETTVHELEIQNAELMEEVRRLHVREDEARNREREFAKAQAQLELDKEWIREEMELLKAEREALKEQAEEQRMIAYDLEEKEDWLNMEIQLMEEEKAGRSSSEP